MALDDQTFSNKPIIAVGASFFADDTGNQSYDLCLRMREDEQLRVAYDFHFLDIEQSAVDVRHVLEVVQGWGAPVVLGKIFPATPTTSEVKSFARIIVSVMKIHSSVLCDAYRYNGVKSLSTYSGEQLITALSLAARDPEPSALTKHLLNVSRY